MRATGQLLVDRLQRRGTNLHDHLAFARNGIWKLIVAWRLAQTAQYSSIHSEFLPLRPKTARDPL